MNRRNWLFLTALVAVVAGAGAKPALAEDVAIGSPDAPVTMIEYASLTCPHCASFHLETLPALKERYIDTGQVRLVMRDFPLDQTALQASVIAHCGGPVRYPGFVDVLFRTQMRWATAADPMAELIQIAKQGGLSEEQIQACLADQALVDEILQTRLTAQNEHDVRSTPSFVIDGETHAGDLGVEGFAEIIDPLLPEEG